MGGGVLLVSEVLLHKVSVRASYHSLLKTGPWFPLRGPLHQHKPRLLFPVEEGTMGRTYPPSALPRQLFRLSASEPKENKLKLSNTFT